MGLFVLLGVGGLVQAPQMAPGLRPTLVNTVAPAILVDVHVEADVHGAGRVQASASSRNGQALTHIHSEGLANGHASVNAPTCRGTCEPLSSSTPMGRDDPELTKESALTKVNGPAGARLVVNGDFVNLRAGPGTDYAVAGVALRGQMFVIEGRSADGRWWQVAPTTLAEAWISNELVQVIEASGVPVLNGWPTAVATLTPTAMPVAMPAPTAPSDYPFAVVRTAQHREANSVTLYVWIHNAAGQALDGYLLDVRQNGVLAPGLRARSAALPLGSTRPACPGCAEDEPYNLKQAWDNRVVYPGMTYGGVWTVQLVDGGGVPVSAVVLFTLAPDDPHLELFVEFQKGDE